MLIRINVKVKYGVYAVLFLISGWGFRLYGQDTSVYTPDPAYIESVVQKAKAMNLGSDPYWHRLLHYAHGVLGYRSIVDDKKFFLSESGKRSPDKELEATIRALFTPVSPDEMHPGVKFISRFDWLNSKLNIDKNKLPFDFEKKFEDFYKTIDAGKAILVFPAGYINSPASMYGHTLLVIEPKNGKRLVSLAVNYAAKTHEEFGPIFAVKGLFGFYDGFYSILPYYEKINEYSSGEMRDMWEYTLNLNEKELRRLMMHIVEMERVSSDYYFLDENCSFNLLCLLEVARGDIDLTSRFKTTIEPIDTLRAVIDSGLVLKRDYRPSLYSQIQKGISAVGKSGSSAAVDYCNGDIDEQTFDRKAQESSDPAGVYDLASDCLKFMAVKEQVSADDYRKRILNILRKRSALSSDKKNSGEGDVPPPPEVSHRSNKLALSYGRFDAKGFVQLSYRPTCHDMIDSDLGISPDNEMVFGNASVRYYHESRKVQLQSFDLLKIFSMPTCSSFFKPNGFVVNSGLCRSPAPDQNEVLAGYLDFGSGYSVMLSRLFHVYGFFHSNFRFSGEYVYNTFGAFGGRSGIISDIADRWKSNIYGEAFYAPWGKKTPVYRVGVQERLRITGNFQIVGEYKYEYIYKRSTKELLGSAQLLF